MKPTYGAISRSGMIAFASSLDQCGPFTRDVRDAALLLATLGGRDDPATRPRSGFPEPIAMPSREDLKGLRIGVPRELRSDAEGIEPGVERGASSGRVALCEELGAEVAETELPNASHGISAYYVLAPAEASANLARYDGVRFGLREDGRLARRDVRANPLGRFRPRGEAADHARHLRALLGLLRRLLRQCPARPDPDRPATSPRRSRTSTC